MLAALVVASLTAPSGKWATSVEWARGRLRQAERSAVQCPVLIGNPRPGNPREAYEQAAKLGDAVDPDVAKRLRNALADTSCSRREAQLLLSALPDGALDSLVDAARTEGSLFDASRVLQPSEDAPLLGLHSLVDGMLLRARHADSEARRADAWLALLSCGLDLCGGESPIVEIEGVMVLQRAMDWCEDRWLSGLRHGQLQRLAAALAMIDARFAVAQDVDDFIMGAILWQQGVAELRPIDLGLASRAQVWRHGFSLHRAGMASVQNAQHLARQFARSTPASAPWELRETRLRQMAEQEKALNDGVPIQLLANVCEFERARREAALGIRMLRMAIAHRLGEPPAQLEDPLANAPIQLEQGGDGKIVIRSALAGGREWRGGR